MKCKNCKVPPIYDEQEHVELCGLFGWDNNDEHFCEYADGDFGCIHIKATIEKWWKQQEDWLERYHG